MESYAIKALWQNEGASSVVGLFPHLAIRQVMLICLSLSSLESAERLQHIIDALIALSIAHEREPTAAIQFALQLLSRVCNGSN